MLLVFLIVVADEEDCDKAESCDSSDVHDCIHVHCYSPLGISLAWVVILITIHSLIELADLVSDVAWEVKVSLDAVSD